MLELKVRKIGNSLGVVLPRKLSTAYSRRGDRLFLMKAQTELTSSRPTTAFEKKMKQAEDIIGRYRNTLHTLSK